MIYLTGASGYLGQHIMRLGGNDVVPVSQDRYEIVRGQCVIHAGWPTPKNETEAYDVDQHRAGYRSSMRLDKAEPRFILLVNTRAPMSAYRAYKDQVVDDAQTPLHSLCLPGLYGPPRRSGLMYNATRAMLTGQTFTPNQPLPDWTGMRVEKAAQLCLDLARAEKSGLTIARDEEFEKWLTFCRE